MMEPSSAVPVCNESAVVIICIHPDDDSDLLLVGDAADGACGDSCLVQRWEKHRSKYRNNRNYHEELYKGEFAGSAFLRCKWDTESVFVGCLCFHLLPVFRFYLVLSLREILKQEVPVSSLRLFRR